MNITLKQAQAAVGEWRDAQSILQKLKDQSGHIFSKLPECAKALARKIGEKQFWCKSGQNPSRHWEKKGKNRFLNECDCYFRLPDDYAFATEPAPSPCADCQHEFQPKVRTFTEAFLDDETIPPGGCFAISSIGSDTFTKAIGGRGELGVFHALSNGAAFIDGSGEWNVYGDMPFNPADLKESDIDHIKKPVSQ